MATDYYIEVAGKRTLAKAPEYMPRVGESILLTNYGRVRASRYVVARIEWAIAQEESPTYFNRPKHAVLYLEPQDGPATEE